MTGCLMTKALNSTGTAGPGKGLGGNSWHLLSQQSPAPLCSMDLYPTCILVPPFTELPGLAYHTHKAAVLVHHGLDNPICLMEATTASTKNMSFIIITTSNPFPSNYNIYLELFQNLRFSSNLVKDISRVKRSLLPFSKWPLRKDFISLTNNLWQNITNCQVITGAAADVAVTLLCSALNLPVLWGYFRHKCS